MPYVKLRRLFFCAYAIVCFSSRDTKADPISIPESLALKPMPTEMVKAYLPSYVSSRSDRWSEARSLISFSLGRIRSRLVALTHDPSVPTLERDLKYLESVFDDLRADAIAAQIFLHSIKSHKPENSIPPLFTQIQDIFDPVHGNNEVRIIYFDVDVLDHYTSDPDYWDGEILRGLVASYLPSAEETYRLRAAYWTAVDSQSQAPGVRHALAEYSRVLAGKPAFGKYYLDDLPGERRASRASQLIDEKVALDLQAFRSQGFSPVSLVRALFTEQSGLSSADTLELQKIWSFSIQNLGELVARKLQSEELIAQFAAFEIHTILEEINERVLRSQEPLRAMLMPEWARGNDLVLDDELLFAEKRSPNVFFVDPAGIQSYWKSPLYLEGEILRVFALLTGRSENQAFQLRGIYWGQFPEVLWDERIHFAQSLYAAGPGSVSPDTWNYYAATRVGYRREDFRRFLRDAEVVLQDSNTGKILTFLRQNFIEGMQEHTQSLGDFTLTDTDLFEVFEQGALQVDASRQILARADLFRSRFDDPTEINGVLNEIERLSEAWVQMVNSRFVVEKLKSDHLLPDRLYDVEAPSGHRERVRVLMGDFVRKAFGDCEDAANS